MHSSSVRRYHNTAIRRVPTDAVDVLIPARDEAATIAAVVRCDAPRSLPAG
jgi:hypothetical protein